MTLSPREKKDLTNWQKGYEGELHFDELTRPFESTFLLLQDLLLKNHSTTFQVDTLLITPNKNYLFEIKNYEGDYVHDDDKFYHLPQSEILNPLHQLQRANALLGQLLTRHGITTPFESYLIFIHPHFTLYQAPQHPSIIYPTQLSSFLRKISPASNPLKGHHRKLADTLTTLHDPNPVLPDLPAYSFDSLQKGIYCLQCSSCSIALKGRSMYCEKCGHIEEFSAAVLRNALEFKQLFPSNRITSTSIYEWCGEIGTPRRIRTVLEKHFAIKGRKRGTYYV
ncbi:NERD domain-containing protein [Halobacillus locisalis]|uniref:NERD domain-containing protein n=1 Tax=Halobacillus locisalis TaxID=220753 RepID=A0A838CWM8_9BACI|nr:nuclease-related domain-containing protein [Halobacillus locisalis]MBA2176016.1 NERD domain-containing protein [Halobacillus locisalis]